MRPVLRPYFTKRDLTTPVAFPDLRYAIQSYGNHVRGGPYTARLTAQGSGLAIMDLVNYMRMGLEIHSSIYGPVWWGYLNSLSLNIGSLSIGLSLDEFANRIKIEYSYRGAGQVEALTSGTTAVAADSDSVSEYGKKERIESLSDADSSQAADRRDALLEILKVPVAVAEVRATAAAASAELSFVGWYGAFEWMYYAQAGANESYQAEAAEVQAVGDVASDEAVAQSFTVSSAVDITVDGVDVMLARVGSPADNVVVALYTDSAGAPNTLIDSYTLAGGNIGAGTPVWETGSLAASQTLTAGATYWVRINRSGAVDATNYFVVGLDTGAGYTGGIFRIYNGASWGARSPDSDMPFLVQGNWTTSAQIEQIIQDADPGSFFQGYGVAASGISSTPYREGKLTAAKELEKLLNTGTSNNRRLMVAVDRQRFVQVTEEPAAGSSDYFLLADGRIENAYGVPEPVHTCPYGIWVRPRELPGIGSSIVDLANIQRLFIERSEYDARTDRLRIWTRGARDPFDLVGLN